VAAIHGFGAVGIIWGFNVGLALVYFMLASRVLLTFPHPVTDLRLALRSYYRAARDYWVVALAATVAVAAIWVDKWVMWLGPSGEYLGDSLLHAPLYDSAMFIAYLVIVPALSFFVMHLETDFFRNYQQFHASIRTHATLQQIEEQVQFLKRGTLISLIRIIVVQASLCAVLVLAVPMMIEVLRLQFRQIPILQFGAIGASFQFVFMACTSLLLFFDRQWTYLLLQLLFLGLNAGLTWLTLQFGIDYYGFGFLLASLVCSLSGVVALVTSFNGLNYHTFMKATDLRTSHNWIGMWQNADGAPRNTKADPATTLYSAGRGHSVSRGRSAIVSR